MAKQDDLFKKIASHCKEYGFIFQSSEIYDGLAATYDYGPYGVQLKNSIKQYWWKSMVQMHENIVGLDTAIFMHPNPKANVVFGWPFLIINKSIGMSIIEGLSILSVF